MRDRLVGVAGAAGVVAVAAVVFVVAFAARAFVGGFVDAVAFEVEPGAVESGVLVFEALDFALVVEPFDPVVVVFATLDEDFVALVEGFAALDEGLVAAAVDFDAFELGLDDVEGALGGGVDSIASGAVFAVVDRRVRGRALVVIASVSPWGRPYPWRARHAEVRPVA